MTRADKRQRQKERSRAAREAREAAFKRQQRKSIALRIGGSLLVVAVIIAGVSVFAGGDDDNSASDTTTTAPTDTTAVPGVLPEGCIDTVPEPNPNRPTFTAAPAMQIDPAKTYTAKLSTTCGDITIALDDDNAPQTANSFVFLARQGFYDGLSFHRVAQDFVVQGGDPTGDGSGGPGYTLPDEPPADGYKAGSVAMANSGSGTTGSQFFLTWTDQGAANLGGPPYLYSSLGTVTEGLDVVVKMGSLANPAATDPSTQAPTAPLYIFTVEITET